MMRRSFEDQGLFAFFETLGDIIEHGIKVCRFEIRIRFENPFSGSFCREQTENCANRDAESANARLSAHHRRIVRNARNLHAFISIAILLLMQVVRPSQFDVLLPGRGRSEPRAA